MELIAAVWTGPGIGGAQASCCEPVVQDDEQYSEAAWTETPHSPVVRPFGKKGAAPGPHVPASF